MTSFENIICYVDFYNTNTLTTHLKQIFKFFDIIYVHPFSQSHVLHNIAILVTYFIYIDLHKMKMYWRRQ